MKRSFLLYLIIYGLLCHISPLRAQESSFADHYNVAYITMSEGLPHHFVDDIYKDSRGFLWISLGGGGLARYDGYEFLEFSPNTPHCKLKSNFIRCAREDRFQRLWVTSEGGIDIIDLNTLQSVLPGGLEPSFVGQPASYVTLDACGCIWVHSGQQLHQLSFRTDGSIEKIRTLEQDGLQQSSLVFKDLEQDGTVWIGLNGTIYSVTAQGETGLQATAVSPCLHLSPDLLFADFIVKENEIWIATNQGLYRYNKNSDTVKLYTHIPGDPGTLSQNFLTSLAITADRQLLVASLRGINIYNPLKDNFEHLYCEHNQDKKSLLNNDFVNCLRIEGEQIWIGTESGGINRLTPKRLALQNYCYDKKKPNGLPGSPVNAIYEDAEGTLWIGNVEGGLSRKEAGSDHFDHYTSEHGALSHNSVSAITADPEGRLWVGTWGGGVNLLDRRHPDRPLKVFASTSPGNYPTDFIGVLVCDTLNQGVWMGTNQGIYFYDLRQQALLAPLPRQANEQITGCIGSLITSRGELWIGCLEGVYIIDLRSRQVGSSEATFRYRHLKYKLDDPSSRLIEKITCLHESPDGTLWLGSNGYGLYRRQTDGQGNETFISYTTEQGLSSNSVRGILEDDKGRLWIATNYGLSCLEQHEQHFTNYTLQDGLPHLQFYWNASFHSPEGKLYFGCMNGLTVIERDLTTSALPSAQLRLTRLRVGNEEIRPGSKLLPVDIAVAREIRIHEREKSFSLEFSALDFAPDRHATYSYRLLGFNDHWMQLPGHRRFASYTNLSPGHYTFQVRYTPDNRQELMQTAELNIIIEPYFYKTLWFDLLIVLLLVLAVWQYLQWRIRTLKRQKAELHQQVELRTHELKEQKQLLEEKTDELSKQNRILTEQNEKITRQKRQLEQMARKVQELTMDKISFFTNITHEFRTPITLIIGPIERALKLSYNPQVIEQLHFVERNSKYLLSLVNQLMDFRKVESGKLEISKSRSNFLKFADEVVAPFAIFARERNIRLNSYYRMPDPEITYDEEATHKVLTNLLSNAIKFTPNGGSVSLFIALLPATANREKTLYLCVSDTGCGIPEEDLAKIFHRFYQSKNQMRYPMYGQSGSGIGLYLCKRIVQALNGEICVRNNPTSGCSFRLLLPLEPEGGMATDTGSITARLPLPAAANSGLPQPEADGSKRLCILVVEDNPDMGSYIRSILRDRYDVVGASDGAQALKILEQQPVDFIVSDLMMPVMDGLELSRRVKENFALSHIPFLMLTAKTSQETRIESYRIGVDAYLMKPFDDTLLVARIENILENRKRYQQRFAHGMDLKELPFGDESSDKTFMQRIIEVMQKNYQNSGFDVSDFCEAMGVSKTLLNTKLQNLAGQSPAQFIRNYRLNLARDLLMQQRGNKQINIADIAYEVGFNDPKYFTRCFIKLFEVKPSTLLNREE